MNNPGPQSLSPLLDQELRAESFKAGMRKFASGVALITSAFAGQRVGLIATAVSSVSTSPPTLLVCVNRSASAHDLIDQSGCIGVNLLSAADLDLVGAFSHSSRRDERFASGDWRTLSTGAPMLASALALFDCKVVLRVPYESHTIFLGEALHVHIGGPHLDPLLHMDRAFRRLESVA